MGESASGVWPSGSFISDGISSALAWYAIRARSAASSDSSVGKSSANRSSGVSAISTGGCFFDLENSFRVPETRRPMVGKLSDNQ